MFVCKHEERKAGRTGVRWAEKGRKPLHTASPSPRGFTVFALGSGQRGSWGEAVDSLQT